MRGLTAIYTVTPKAKLLSLEFPTDDLRKFVEATQLLANDEGGLSGFSDEIWLDMVKKVVFSYFLSFEDLDKVLGCLLYTSPSPRDATLSRMPSSA